MSKFLKTHTWFFVVFVVCAVLRFIPLFQYQFTLDELSGLSRTTFDSFSELIEKGVKTTDTHPALIQLFIYGLAKLFGYANWVIKLPFLLMSLGAIVYAYVFSLRNFSKQTGVVASVIFSFSFIFVFYAPIARMYVCGVFLSIALLFYFFEIFFKKDNRLKNYLLLGLFALLCALNQHLNCLFAFTVCASGLVFIDKSNFKKYMITCICIVLCYLPHLPVTLYQFNIGGIGFDQDGWLPPPTSSAIFDLTKVFLGTGKTFVVFLMLIVLAIVLNRTYLLNKMQLYLFLIFLINYLVIYFYSVYRAPVFQYSVMLFSGVALVVGIASLIYFKNRVVFNVTVFLLSGVLIYKSYFKKDFFHESVKTVFEYQFERTFYYKNLYGNKNVYPFFFDADQFMKTIYFQKYKSSFDCSISSDAEIKTDAFFSKKLLNLQGDYVVMASSSPAQQAFVKEYFPFLIENTQTQGINYKVYSRNPADKGKEVDDDEVLAVSDVSNPGAFIFKNISKPLSNNKDFIVSVDSLNEFPFDAKAKYAEVVSAEGQMLLVTSKLKLKTLTPGAIESCISLTDQTNGSNINYNAAQVMDFNMRPDSTVWLYSNTFFGTSHSKTPGDAVLSAYIWNRGKEKFSINNFEIRLINFCPKKWQLWH
jgi:hypothetical protein